MDVEEATRNFCRCLGYLRQKHGLTQRQMAQILGVSPGRLRRMEREDMSCRYTLTHLQRLCGYFQISGDDVLLGRIGQ